MRDWRMVSVILETRFYLQAHNLAHRSHRCGHSLAACYHSRDSIIHYSRGGPAIMAHQHPPRFLKIVEDAKQRVRETNVDEVKARLDHGEKFALIDVREDR